MVVNYRGDQIFVGFLYMIVYKVLYYGVLGIIFAAPGF